MRVYLSSLGCVRNQVDSEIMMGRLSAAGHRLVDDPVEAEAIVVNTCAFIESAQEEAVEEILTLARHKSRGACRRLIVAGCLPQRHGRQIAGALPEVDVFLGTGAYDRIEEALETGRNDRACILSPPRRAALQTWQTPRICDTWPVAYVKIMEGCGRHCTYCIIPKLRGPLRSRQGGDIARETRLLADQGFSEIIVVGQDTTSWGVDRAEKEGLAGLLARIAGAAPRRWVRFLYGHPDRVSDRLLDVMAAGENICRYLDIPVQHAAARVLKAMGRRYRKEDVLALLSRIRSRMPDAAVRTTVLVGFPGETDADFEELLEFVEAAQFDHLGAFIYSDAEDLPSHRLAGHVPAQVAQDRHDTLMMRQADISLAKNREKIGRQMEVLVEGRTEDGRFFGRTRYQAPEVDGVTFIESGTAEIGGFVQVRILDADEYDLTGVPV